LLRLFGLTARPAYQALWRELEQAPERLSPIRWSEIDPASVAGLVLPGGHWKRGMRQLIEGPELQAAALRVLRAGRPVAAICHGVLALARTIDPETGRSVLAGRRVAALTASLEQTAYFVTRPFLGDYYKTYSE